MPSKRRYPIMFKDDLAWEKLEEVTDEWEASIRKEQVYRVVGRLILKYKPGPVEVMHQAMRYEVATMRYVAANTTIPVPHVYHYGAEEDNPTGLGPFIIMDYIEHHQNMSRELGNPNFQPTFPQIGSHLRRRTSLDREYERNHRSYGAPESILPSQPFTSAGEWCSPLADMHTAQLAFQHNDAVEDEADARDKYTARQLLRTLAAEGRLASEPEPDDGYRLFSEDFRPANVLLDEDLKVVAVIDWDYAAPSQFSSDPPWWLFLQDPESWAGGYRPWMEAYEPRLQTFLRVLEAEEAKMAATVDVAAKLDGLSLAVDGKVEVPLSQRMRESWEKRTWLLSYAIRKSWAFDFAWWKFLDETYFGENENQDSEARLDRLSPPQRQVMDSLVARKLEESRKPEIVQWDDEGAAECLAELLV